VGELAGGQMTSPMFDDDDDEPLELLLEWLLRSSSELSSWDLE
jgi:hypothetical protein